MLSARASRFAASLDLDVDRLRLCPLCLWAVSTEIHGGNEAAIREALSFFTPLLWDEGLAEPALAAVERASRRGLTDAAAALQELAEQGSDGCVARAVVRRLAQQFSERAQASWEATMN
jgi:hypothetical protein